MKAVGKHNMRNKNNYNGKDKSKQKNKDKDKNRDRDEDSSNNQNNLSIQVSSSSNRLKVASKKRKNITPNAYGSMTDADETGLTQSPKGQKSSRFVCYDEKEDEDDNEEGEDGGEERKGNVGKGKGQDRLFKNDDFNNISTEGDPDLDVEGMWREVGGEIGGEKEKVKKRDDIVEGVRGRRGGEGGDCQIGVIKERTSDIGTIKQIERLLRRQSDTHHALNKEREKGRDERPGYGEFSEEEDSDGSNDTNTSSSSCPSPSPSPFSSSSSPSSSSPGSRSSGEYSNHDNNNSSSSCSGGDGDIDALVIKEQEISKMIQLSQSVCRTTSYCVMPCYTVSFIRLCIHSVIRSFIWLFFHSFSIVTFIFTSSLIYVLFSSTI